MKKRKWTKEEVHAYMREHGWIVYCNREDGNFAVRKLRGNGWTLNMAHPGSWVVMAAGAAIVAVSLALK